MREIKSLFLITLIVLSSLRVSAALNTPDDLVCYHEHNHYEYKNININLKFWQLFIAIGAWQLLYNHFFPATEEKSSYSNIDWEKFQNLFDKINSEELPEMDSFEKREYVKLINVIKEIENQKEIIELKYLDTQLIYKDIKKDNLKEVMDAVYSITHLYDVAQKASILAKEKANEIPNNQDMQKIADISEEIVHKIKKYLTDSQIVLLHLNEAKILQEIKEEENKALGFVNNIAILCQQEIQNMDEIEKAKNAAIEAADIAFSKAAKIALMQEAQIAAVAAHRYAQKAKKRCKMD